MCLAVGGGNGAGAAFVGAPFLGTRGVGPGSCGPSDVGGVGSGFGLTPAAPSGDAAVAESEPAALRPAIGSRPERRRWSCVQPLDKRTAVGVARPADLQRMYRSPTPVAHRCALLLPGAGGETFLHASAVGRQATETHPDQSATIGRAALLPGGVRRPESPVPVASRSRVPSTAQVPPDPPSRKRGRPRPHATTRPSRRFCRWTLHYFGARGTGIPLGSQRRARGADYCGRLQRSVRTISPSLSSPARARSSWSWSCQSKVSAGPDRSTSRTAPRAWRSVPSYA